MIVEHLALAFFWIIYGVLHSLLASSKMKDLLKPKTGFNEDNYRLAYNIFAIITLAVLIYFQLKIKSVSLFYDTSYSKIIALLFIAAGLIIMSICIIKYFGQLSGIKAQAQIQKLEITGVHKMVRHPLYLGTFIFLTGLFLWFPTVATLCTVVIIITYTIIGIRFEEAKLIRKFGNDYIQYQKKVPMILPLL